ncbi:hypothetical protein RM555_11200 [Micromonospora sp. DSM 115977]|uniref:Uncharacterized protein n=1 Tax=Micromonospora reichwaldensis TaxID=3075516 RepID=A0ABU2WVB0_9ACTN|nr:hypothetical protein [Micromonospora sp. DSM 115977]MDT0529554.1 hypothetical protein [Micromonospora sp. DSM 115977]
MDADAADRSETGPDAGGHTAGVAADDRLRGAVLAVAGLAALVGGGFWWQADAPRTGPVPDLSNVAPPDRARLAAPPDAHARFVVPPEGSGRPASFWLVDPRSGATVRTDPRGGAAVRVDPRGGAAVRVDPRGGAAVRVDADDPEQRRAGDDRLQAGDGRRGRLASFPDTVWTARAVLSPAEVLLKRASAEGGERHLLQYRCVGPGELLIVVEGAWAADPITSACDGSVTSTEVTGRGGPFQVSLSSANAEPLRVEAQLVALP